MMVYREGAPMMRMLLYWFTAVVLMAFAVSPGYAANGKTDITWYGHSAFKVVTPTGHVLFIDPWIVNPVNKDGQQDLDNITKADLVLVSHGHFDHVGQAADIAKKTKARLVATFDLGNALAAYGGYPKELMGFDSLGNFGGVLSFFEDEVKIAFVPAIHSSAVASKALNAGNDENPHDAGNPGGFVIMIKNGPTIYHTGDTDLFSDMALIKQHAPIDVMLTCIGGHFTMGPERAAEAVRLVNPAHVIPMHYGTFPSVLPGTVTEFSSALKKRGLANKQMSLQVDQTIHF
jgi:L-ascorbate metabolism protein UlaG (beta-lactamase superfamily)